MDLKELESISKTVPPHCASSTISIGGVTLATLSPTPLTGEHL